MFYNQPLSIRFGNELSQHVGQTDGIEPYWDRLDIAVAWVRASGMDHLFHNLVGFLRLGGKLSVIVGIDLENTTQEGLERLLDLESYGDCETHVYHNEARSTFHPKLYLFRNALEARLIVGSNNITESGLFTNVEAGLQVDTNINEIVIGQADDALRSWRDTKSKLAVRLDRSFLNSLICNGYVPTEAIVRNNRASKRKDRETAGFKKLFESREFTPPPGIHGTGGHSGGTNATPGSSNDKTVLLMRLRKASATARPTQTQIPIRVFNVFFKGVATVCSLHSGQVHRFIQARARGSKNTIKLEIPEMASFTEPFARFEKTSNGIVYEVYDVGSPKGNQIKASLEDGMLRNVTLRSVKSMKNATWWRFI